jgi:hypothetical protein
MLNDKLEVLMFLIFTCCVMFAHIIFRNYKTQQENYATDIGTQNEDDLYLFRPGDVYAIHLSPFVNNDNYHGD